MSDKFDKQRRQQFLTKRYFEATDKNYDLARRDCS